MKSNPSAYMPSVMCSNLRCLERDMAFYAQRFAHLHIDVCDGHFCPHLAAGPDIVNALRAISPIGMDYHLMTERPESMLALFDIRPGDQVSVQLETLRAPTRLFERIREQGARAFAALAPATPASALEYLWPCLDGVTVMMFEPGCGKQTALEGMYDKLAAIRRAADRRGLTRFRLQADGNVSAETAPRMAACGADQFVLGSSGLYTGGAVDAKKLERLTAAVKAERGEKI